MLAFVSGVPVGADMMMGLFFWGDNHWGFVLPLLLTGCCRECPSGNSQELNF